MTQPATRCSKGRRTQKQLKHNILGVVESSAYPQKIFLAIFMLMFFMNISQGKENEGQYTITADHMESTKKNELTVFTGNVKLVKDKVTIKADRVEDHKNDGYVLAVGKVHGMDNTSPEEEVEIFCEKAKYNRDISSGVLTGNPRVVRTGLVDKNKGVEIKGDVIEILEKGEKSIVRNNVQVKQNDMLAVSDLLDYDSNLKKIILTGGTPKVYQKSEEYEAEYSAETITMFSDEQRVIFEKGFNAIIYSK